MNIGDCPYDDCDGVLVFAVPDKTPAYTLDQCHCCGRDVWYRLSRIDPAAWTVDDFHAEHEINQATRTIKRREPPNAE